MELHHGAPAVHVRVGIFQVGVVVNWFLEGFIAEVVGELLTRVLFPPDDSAIPMNMISGG